MNRKEILRLLAEREVVTVLVGGLAMRIQGAQRTSQAMSLAVRALDVDAILEMLYERGFAVITAVGPRSAHALPTPARAADWAEATGASALTLVETGRVAGLGQVPLDALGTQIDLLFDLPVPVMRLRQRARAVVVDQVTLYVACPEDLLALRRQTGGAVGDQAEIAALEEIVGREGRQDQ